MNYVLLAYSIFLILSMRGIIGIIFTSLGLFLTTIELKKYDVPPKTLKAAKIILEIEFAFCILSILLKSPLIPIR